MIYAKFLGNQMNHPPLLGGKCPREREFVPHAVVLEKEDPGVNLESRRVIQIQLVRQGRFFRWIRSRRCHRRRSRRVKGLRDRERGQRRGILRLLICRSSRERTLGGKCWGSNGPKIVIRLLNRRRRLLFLFQLHRAHPADCLFSLDALLFTCLQDFFVLYAEFSTLNVEAIQGSDDGICVGSLAEVGKGQAAEGALLIEMVIEGIWGRNRQRCLERMC